MNITDDKSTLQQEINQEGLLHRMTNRIRQSLELKEILTATVAEIRSFLGTERVLVYRFHQDGSGEVIAESIKDDCLPSLLGLNFPADDIPPAAKERILKTRQRSIVNVATREIGISPLDCAETGKPLNKVEISYRPADPCHIQYLIAMGVQFSLAVPILHRDQLWGLLVSHNSQARLISESELQLIQRVADQTSVAIAQSTLLTQAREQAFREAQINRVATLLHTQSTGQIQAAFEETVAIFQGSGGRLYIFAEEDYQSAEIYICGTQPNEWGLGTRDWEKALKFAEQQPHGLWAITDIYKQPQMQDLAIAFQSTPVRGMLIATLQYRQQTLGYLIVFRDEIDTETLWAGHFDTDKRQMQPRRSFQVWRELRKGQAPQWSETQIEMAHLLGNQFSMAIHQYQLYQQVQRLNTNLEQQVQERTAQLQQSLQLAKVVKQVTDQIRSTLDIKTILQTIVREVRKLLNTDRVVIYQFTENWEGEIVVEDVIGYWLHLKGNKIKDDCFSGEHACLYEEGRVRAINDVVRSDLSPCHIEFLQRIQVKANLVVPIRMGERLWGLLIAHECDRPRVWLAPEIEMLQQLADEAAIAIQQAELYQQSCTTAELAQEQAQQISQALHELQETQTHLIQSEKMSSLGELVAGIAHEINNPVNFIYGNLTYTGEYVHSLLNLVETYQKHYPNPTDEVADLIDQIDLEFLIEDLSKILSSMKVGTERIRQLVLSLRNFSRLDQADRKPVDIHEGLDSTILILQHRFKPKQNAPKINIVKSYGQLPLIECYAGPLNQVFMNVISNAIDALEDESKQISNPEIRIGTELLTNDRVVIRIADNGTGIPEEVQAKIFDPFFTTKPVGKGTGLGLSISYQIVVEKHGGVFKCYSKPNQGTEFWIELPINS